MTTARVVSVNVGGIRNVEWHGRIVSTGIWKQPTNARVALRGVNFVGDDQADRTVHGGVDKAVYAYATEDYEYWRDSENLNTTPGLFGENLTVEGLDLPNSCYGDQWSVGSALLEVAQPRLPCFKLGIRVGDDTFLKRFMLALRPGAYLRILQEGEIGAGDEIRIVHAPKHRVTLRHMVQALRDRNKAEALQVLSGLPELWQNVADSADD